MHKLDDLDCAIQQKRDEDKQIKTVVYRLLGRREYSRCELARKLLYKGFCEQKFNPVLDQFTQKNLQSDQRFAEVFCRFRAGKGYGPFKIESELRLRGVSDEIIAQTLDSVERDWYKTAKEIIERRFGVEKAVDIKNMSKQWRFLQNRGFTPDQIKMAIEYPK